MSIATALSRFLHRTKDDVKATEAELRSVLKAVEEHVSPKAKTLASTVTEDVVTEFDKLRKDVATEIEAFRAGNAVLIAEATAKLSGDVARVATGLEDLKKTVEALVTASTAPGAPQAPAPAAKKTAAKKTAATPPAAAAASMQQKPETD